ncbi:hypothetical protein VNI00_018629 [Paramarasmius palmivorus]|uniref:Uncharacterized protein n=1 Tax=Paramarasmius palmivorus TaxID=297713 RepID=A0AAW0AWE2_9AGAR
MFVEGDWAKKLDKHAELVLSVQTEVTGFRVRSIEAVEDEGTGILRYIADCVMSNGIDDQIRDVLRDIDHTSEPDSLDAPSPMVQENDGDKETGEIKKLTKLESPESPPDMADEEDEEAMDEN